MADFEPGLRNALKIVSLIQLFWDAIFIILKLYLINLKN